MARASAERREWSAHRISRCAPAILAVLLSGCVSTSRRDEVAKALGSGARAPAAREVTVEESYRLACPDVVEIAVAGSPQSSGKFVLNAEGRIALEEMHNPRVEGETAGSLAKRVAVELGVSEDQVTCRVVRHESRAIFVHGAITGGDRAIPYRGTENLVSFLRRCGGLAPAADVRDVHLVRGNVASGGRPQVFTIDLEAILVRGEPTTNVLLQPYDEIYIGARPRAMIGDAMPDLLRPLYRAFCKAFPNACPKDWRQPTRDSEP
jgi:protein involved in polysaccharide export with SLBB domain